MCEHPCQSGAYVIFRCAVAAEGLPNGTWRAAIGAVPAEGGRLLDVLDIGSPLSESDARRYFGDDPYFAEKEYASTEAHDHATTARN